MTLPGRLRTRATLVDGHGRTTMAIRRGLRGRRLARATEADGAEWTVLRRGGRMEVLRDGVERAVIDGAELTVGGRSFVWRLAEDGSREAQVTPRSGRPQDDGEAGDAGPSPGAGPALRIRPPLVDDDGERAPGIWITVDVDEELPEAFGIVLAACARLLQIGGSGHWTPTSAVVSPGPGPSPNGDNREAAVRYGPGI